MSVEVSQERWDQEWRTNVAVLRNLRSHGDNPSIERNVDVSFRGPLASLRRLASSASNYGYEIERFHEKDEDGAPWLFLVRSQRTDDDAIREMTETYLLIEDDFGVECDGWGCLATNANGPIDDENPA
jgi:regulator of RNase E activity RraB